MSLSNQEKKQFRIIGHGLKPVVTVADRGLTESVVAELKRALDDHELVKVKLAISDRDLRKALAQSICTQLEAEMVQEIGKVVLLFKASREPNPRTSNIRS